MLAFNEQKNKCRCGFGCKTLCRKVTVLLSDDKCKNLRAVCIEAEIPGSSLYKFNKAHEANRNIICATEPYSNNKYDNVALSILQDGQL